MSIRVTDNENVALYDSVRGRAFGPIFESESDAEDFLEWVGDGGRELLRISLQHTEELVVKWQNQRDGETAE